jgi:diguanylate cyclase (GGDEF)-like protein/PAS domain S-box-containing protein
VRKNKPIPFISIKWKTLFVFGILLLTSHGIQYLISYNQLIKQFEQQRDHEQQYQLAIAKNMIKQSARLMEQTAESIPLLAQSLSHSPSNNLSSISTTVNAINLHWENLQANWGITALHFYNRNAKPVGQWGYLASGHVSSKQVKSALKSEKPSSILSCVEKCYQIVLIPTLSNNQSNGLLLLARSLADIIITFETATNIDIAILKPVTQPRNSTNWPLAIAASSHPKELSALFRQLKLTSSTQSLLQNEIIIDDSNKVVGARLFELSTKREKNSPLLLLVTNLTQQYQQIERVKNQSLYTILLALIISILLLFSLLLKQTQRVISVTKVLPALSKGAFEQVRKTLQKNILSQKWNRDEFDLLDESTLLVTKQLEESEKIIQEKTHQLSAQNRKIAHEHAFINELLNTAPVIIMTQTVTGKINSVNQQGCELLHLSPKVLIDKPFEKLLFASLNSEIKQQLNAVRLGKLMLLRHESSVQDPKQGLRMISWVHKHLVAHETDSITTLSIGQDVTEQKEAEAHLIWLADHDPLTNLFNRRRFQSEFEQQLKVAERYQKRGAILYFDLDQFKYVNDASGHSAGDKLLQKVSETLQQIVRTSDTLARLGGDEFALLIPETDAEGAKQLAQKILDKLRGINFQASGNTHNISASVGISLFPEHGSNIQDFMANADLAMYQAKESGRGRWHLFAPEEQTKELLKTRIQWKEKIETALKEERLVLHYQPILDVTQGKISHAEVLVRMIGKKGELIMPGDFIPTAEHTGLINQIDLTVLKLAFKTLHILRTTGNPLKLSVNLSGRAFDNPELINFLKNELNKDDVDAEKLIFEVTETTAVANLYAAKEMMVEIKKSGAKFALDDFGVGYASFHYLRQLPVDFVKIDGSFVRQLAKHKEDQVLVQAIVEISNVSGKKTIAEFVENQPILDLLDDYGVDYAQGYHIAKPSAEIPWGEIGE